MGEPEKFHRRKYHLISHPGDGIPWSQNLPGSYGPGEAIKPQPKPQEIKKLIKLK